MNTRLLSAFAISLVLLSCDREDVRTVQPGDGKIVFASPLQAPTKVTATPAGTNFIFQVRDYYNNSSYYIDNESIVYGTSGEWRYRSGRSYTWSNGLHNFFGWSMTDGEISTPDFFGSSPSLSGLVATLPAKEVNTSVLQYDFLYSNMVTRNTVDNDYTPIPLTFKHLFAQIGISFKVDDISNEEITVKRVYLANTMNIGKAASIDYSTGEPVVTYTPVSTGYFVTPKNLNIAGFDKTSTSIDVLSQIQNGGRQFYYTWPMEESELQDAIVVEYTLTKNEFGDPVNIDYVSVMSFPRGTKWKPGHKYQYVIAYMGGILKVNLAELPWDYEESSGSDIPEAIIVTWKGWNDSTCSIDGTDITFIENPDGSLKDIHGMFSVSSPTHCTVHINLSNYIAGEDAAYIIKDASGNPISSGGILIGEEDGVTPGGTVHFYISAIPGKRPAYGQSPLTSTITFSLTSSGHDVSLDSELQRDGQYTIIIPPASE